MQAYVIENESDKGIDAITLTDVPQPQPEPGQVLIKVHAVGLNPVDYKLAQWGNPAWTYPHTLGLDVAGEIVALGPNVSETWQVGMRVAGHGDLRYNGCFAQYVAAPTYELALIPAALSYTTAAGLLCSALTAYQSINRKPNLNLVRTALIHGGSGAVGSIAVQLAKMHGITTFTTASTAKLDEAKKLNPDAVIDYQTEDVTARVQELTNNLGADLIVDTVSAEESAKDLDRLAYNGQLVTIVGIPQADPNDMFARGLSINAVNLGGAHSSGNPIEKRDLGTMASDVLEMASQGSLNPMIERILPFEKLKEGLTMLANHEIAGKLVVTLDN